MCGHLSLSLPWSKTLLLTLELQQLAYLLRRHLAVRANVNVEFRQFLNSSCVFFAMPNNFRFAMLQLVPSSYPGNVIKRLSRIFFNNAIPSWGFLPPKRNPRVKNSSQNLYLHFVAHCLQNSELLFPGVGVSRTAESSHIVQQTASLK